MFWLCLRFFGIYDIPCMNDFAPCTANQLPLNEGVRLIAHNGDGLVALDKPSGMMSHPNAPDENSQALLNADYDLDAECYFWTDESGTARKAWLINRLDSPTSGVILLGLNPEISRTIKQQFATHKVTKIYYALVRGKPSALAGSWSDKLKKDVYRNGRLQKHSQTVPAKTRFQKIKSPPGGFPVTLIKLSPLTGRTHQLRVQCSKHGLPIVGDRTYGNFSFNKEVSIRTEVKRMLLHSGETIVKYCFKGKVREFAAKSELPDAFNSVFDYRPGLKDTKLEKESRSSVLAQRRFKDAPQT